MDYKDEFNYHAVTLIFGLSCPRLQEFNIYSFDTMKKHPELKFIEVSNLTPENILDTHRELTLPPHRSFIADHCQMSSGTCRILTFHDSKYNIHVSDSIFSDNEYEYFTQDWSTTVKNKIRTLGMLIRSVYSGELIEIPLLINEFPNITGMLLNYPDVWMKD